MANYVLVTSPANELRIPLLPIRARTENPSPYFYASASRPRPRTGQLWPRGNPAKN